MVREPGSLEAEAMDFVWAQDQAVSVGAVRAGLNQGRAKVLAYTTVLTLLTRLHAKGRVTREPQGRAFLYRAAESRDAYTARVMAETLSNSADRSAALLRFIEHLGDDESQALRDMLNRQGRNGSS